MNAKIFSFEKLVGIAKLQTGDVSMGHLYGEFMPTEDYYKYVQPTIRKVTSSFNPSNIGNH